MWISPWKLALARARACAVTLPPKDESRLQCHPEVYQDHEACLEKEKDEDNEELGEHDDPLPRHGSDHWGSFVSCHSSVGEEIEASPGTFN